ncbi:MAG: L-2-amino-thiazoline-4-carboxylic acid hydrolase [Candidatus Thorarchaeota archaeon]
MICTTQDSMNRFQVKMDITVEDHFRVNSAKLVSLVRELELELGKDKAHEIVSNWAEKNAINDVKSVIDSLEKPLESFEDVKALLRHWVETLNKDNMETVEITEETSTKSVCIVTECVYGKVFNDLGAPDIGYLLYCQHDFAAAPAIHPNVRVRRTQTVMQNDDCCDFEYYWVGK